MKRFPLFEVAISDADRAEVEAIYIELMRERDAAQAGSEIIATHPSEQSKDSGAK
jgi:hypothetical protein